MIDFLWYSPVALGALIILAGVAFLRVDHSRSSDAAQRKKMSGTIVLFGAMIATTGLGQLTSGPWSEFWTWLGGVALVAGYILTKKLGGAAAILRTTAAQRQHLEAWEPSSRRSLSAALPDSTHDCLILLDVKRPWWTKNLPLPRACVNGEEIPILGGVNEIWVPEGSVTVDLHCVGVNRYGDASILLEVSRQLPRTVYYAEPATSFIAGSIAEKPVKNRGFLWLSSGVSLALILGLGTIIAIFNSYLSVWR